MLATHGYLPLLRHTPETVRAEVLTAVREYERLLREHPLGIWMPECTYYMVLDQQLLACGLRYSILDGHGQLHGQPRHRYGTYTPICSPGGVAFLVAIALRRCRSGVPRMAIRIAVTDVNFTAIWVGIFPRNDLSNPESPDAAPWG